MKILVCVITYNCAGIMPWFLRHYESFADTIWAWDDKSDDGTAELLKAHPKVFLKDWAFESGINEDVFLKFTYDTYPEAAGYFDWVIWVDPDEFIYAPNVRSVLNGVPHECELVLTNGFNMIGDGLPKDNGQQIWKLLTQGVHSQVYSKPVVFRPECKIRWVRGKHSTEGVTLRHTAKPLLKLLHYRYLGGQYTAAGNAKNYARCGLTNGDKGAAWTCHPDFKGPHSAEWAEAMKHHAYDVINTP